MSSVRAAFAVRSGLALAILAIVFGALTNAYAHAEPISITPGDGAVLAAAPTQITMNTSEAMAGAPDSDLGVFNAAGAKVNTAAAVIAASKTTISLALPAGLPVGVYTVQWKTRSAIDGDDADGTWTFTFDPSKPAAAGNPVPALEPDETPTATPATPTAAPSTPVATATPTRPPATPAPATPAPATPAPATAVATPTTPPLVLPATPPAPAAPRTGTSPESQSSSTPAAWELWAGALLLAAGATGFVVWRSRTATRTGG